MPFLNGIRVKGLYTQYNDVIILPSIRRFVYKHIINLDKALNRIKRASSSISNKS